MIAIALISACGISAFLSMRSIYLALPESLNNYYSKYHFGDLFAQARRAPESLGDEIQEIPGVVFVETRVIASVTLDLPSLEEPARGKIVSIPDKRPPELNQLFLLNGRYPEPGIQGEVIASGAFAEANNLSPGAELDAVINGKREHLRIVGIALSPEFVYEISGGEILPDNRRNGVLWMRRSAVASAYGMTGAFNDIVLSLAPGASEAQTIERIDRILDSYGGLGAYGRSDQTSNHFITNEIKELSVTSTYIPGIFLAVTAFLLHLVLSRLIATEREQIALLKAFGYRNIRIGLHYLGLALLGISGGIAVGALFGVWFGYRMTALYAEFFRIPMLTFRPAPSVIIWAVSVSFLAAIAGSVQSVITAMRLPPAEAMRPAAPASFATGILDRLGISSLASPGIRMIARNLTRYALRTVLSILGVSLAVALLVTGLFLYHDAIAQVLSVTFDATEREDVYVGFRDRVSRDAGHQISQFPGVLRAEATLMVPVRLRSGSKSRRVAVTGLEAGAQLRRVVDADFRLHQVTESGILLSSQLGRVLEARPGQHLEVDVLDGRRRTASVVINGYVDDAVGLSAYMDISALGSLIGEPQTVSGFFLQVEGGKLRELYRKLKETPLVFSVFSPAGLRNSFMQTIARTMNVSTGILLSFAVIIAFGVVYNSARISLSERGRELASLRVMGFSRSETLYFLLGEQGAILIASMPIGFLCGYLISWLIINVVDTELMRLTLAVSTRTYVLSGLVVAGAAAVSGVIVARRLFSLDLIAVLKTRE